jgi:hypothetical protein
MTDRLIYYIIHTEAFDHPKVDKRTFLTIDEYDDARQKKYREIILAHQSKVKRKFNKDTDLNDYRFKTNSVSCNDWHVHTTFTVMYADTEIGRYIMGKLPMPDIIANQLTLLGM